MATTGLMFAQSSEIVGQDGQWSNLQNIDNETLLATAVLGSADSFVGLQFSAARWADKIPRDCEILGLEARVVYRVSSSPESIFQLSANLRGVGTGTLPAFSTGGMTTLGFESDGFERDEWIAGGGPHRNSNIYLTWDHIDQGRFQLIWNYDESEEISQVQVSLNWAQFGVFYAQRLRGGIDRARNGRFANYSRPNWGLGR